MAKLATPFVAGFFNDPDHFVAAAHASTAKGWNAVHEGFLPYPVHAAFDALAIKRSSLGRPVLAILIIGAVLGFLMQWWMMKIDWPIWISGKPFNSWPAYVVITFESGVLMGAVGTFLLVLLVYCKLIPDPVTKVVAQRLTDDQFCLAIPIGPGRSQEQLEAFFAEQGADAAECCTTEQREPRHAADTPFDA